jgi:hypothetical protein
MCDGGGGEGLKCTVDHILQEFLHSVSDQIRNLQNCFTAPNKMTSEDDIKGLVSLTSFVHGVIVQNQNHRRLSERFLGSQAAN